MNKLESDPAFSTSSTSSFSDSTCLSRLVAHLACLRNQKAMSVEKVAKRAGVKKEVIRRAEESAVTPSSRVFKAWAGVLGTSWDELWSETMLSARRQEVARTATAPNTTGKRRKAGSHVIFRM